MEEWYDPKKATYPLKMPKKFELEPYLSLSVKELLNLLNSTATTQIFRALATLSLRNLIDDQFQSLENRELIRQVAVEGITFKNRKLAYNLFCQLYPDQLDQISLGESKEIGYVYFLQEKKYGSVKIGRSLNIDKRLSLFVTDLPYPVVLLGYICSLNFEKIELGLHRHFRFKRLGGEWFDLSAEEISNLKQHRFPEVIQQLIVP